MTGYFSFLELCSVVFFEEMLLFCNKCYKLMCLCFSFRGRRAGLGVFTRTRVTKATVKEMWDGEEGKSHFSLDQIQ